MTSYDSLVADESSAPPDTVHLSSSALPMHIVMAGLRPGHLLILWARCHRWNPADPPGRHGRSHPAPTIKPPRMGLRPLL